MICDTCGQKTSKKTEVRCFSRHGRDLELKLSYLYCKACHSPVKNSLDEAEEEAYKAWRSSYVEHCLRQISAWGFSHSDIEKALGTPLDSKGEHTEQVIRLLTVFASNPDWVGSPTLLEQTPPYTVPKDIQAEMPFEIPDAQKHLFEPRKSLDREDLQRRAFLVRSLKQTRQERRKLQKSP